MNTPARTSLWRIGGCGVMLGLLAASSWFWLAGARRDRQVSRQLTTSTEELKRLARRDPYPNADNIKAAQSESAKLQAFLAELNQHFAPAPRSPVPDSLAFRSYLENTIARLRSEARTAGVDLPAEYWFSFAAQRGVLTFAPATLEPLACQVAEVASLCRVLFEAKVNSIAWIKRVPAGTQDTLGAQDYLSAPAVTNTWAVLMPYEVAFEGFSGQLAKAFEALAGLPECFIVSDLAVEPAARVSPVPEQPNLFAPLRRYPLLPPRHDAQSVWLRPSGRQPGTWADDSLLREKPLRITLRLQAVRLRPAQQMANLPSQI